MRRSGVRISEAAPLTLAEAVLFPLSETIRNLIHHSEWAERLGAAGINAFMGSSTVDQIASGGVLVSDVDTKISTRMRHDLLVGALPGASVETYGGVKVVRWDSQILLSKQVTYLGNPWQSFKKRIQIPGTWIDVHDRARSEGMTPRFVGVYHYEGTTIFVDFDPQRYVDRDLNNSSAHVATNDLFQAQTLGQFSREDKNGNRITSIRPDQLHAYLRAGFEEKNPHIDALDRFSREFLDGTRIESLSAVQSMYEASWPEWTQGEWPGFYVEFCFNAFIQRHNLDHLMLYQKEKKKGAYDFDLRFLDNGVINHFGDLKASDVNVRVAPGNDEAKLRQCLDEFGRFWYVIFEHETWKSRDYGDTATREWNIWRRNHDHKQTKEPPFDPLSYWSRFKEAVRFDRIRVLEVNPANVSLVLADFKQGRQYEKGKPRNLKKSITKKNMDNFLIYTKSRDLPLTA